MNNPTHNLPKYLMAAIAVSLLAAGCATHRRTSFDTEPRTTPAMQPTPPAQPRGRVVGPTVTTFEQGGVRFVKSSMAFPTGDPATSGLMLEKTYPGEVLVGQPFEQQYRVTNLTDTELRDVRIWDQVSGNFDLSQSDPQPEISQGVATWVLGDLGPRESKTVRILGAGQQEGTIATCGWASYQPVLCEAIRVVRANLELAKTAPQEVLICEQIPIRLVVQNSGSSALSGVRVVDRLPEGLTANGQSQVSFDVGNLGPGERREFTFNAQAAKPGRYGNTAQATSAQGVEATADAEIVVRQPLLALECQAPEERFVGRPVEVCFTVSNKGDGASPQTVVELPVPAGVTFSSATAGGQLSGNSVVWNVGSLAAEASQELCATFVPTQVGTLQFRATAKGACADPAQTACDTRVSGIPAILLEVVDLDDPIEVGNNVVYEITVTNQGSAPGTNIRIVCDLENAQQFVSGTGTTPVTGEGQRVITAPVASLPPRAQAVWRITVRAAEASNVRFKVTMTSDQIERPVEETESTNQY